MMANLNEKGRQTKLLAAIAVLAMVVCALAVVMPSVDGSTDGIDVPSVNTPVDADDTVTWTAGTNYLITENKVLSGKFTIPETTNIYINEGVTLKIDDGSTKKIHGSIYVLGTGTLEISSTGITMGDKSKIVVEAGSIIVGTIDNTTGVEFFQTVIGGETAPVQMTSGTATITGISYTVAGIADGITMTVNLDGNATVRATSVTQESTTLPLFGQNTTLNIDEGSKLTIPAGTTATFSGKVVNNGSIDNQGTFLCNKDNYSGNGGLTGPAYAGGQFYPTIAAALAVANDVLIYGDSNENVTLANGKNLYVATGSTYSGTITWTDGTKTQNVTLTIDGNGNNTVSAAATGLTITGDDSLTSTYTESGATTVGTDTMLINSNIVISDARSTDSAATPAPASITVIDVAFNGALNAPVTVGAGSAVIPVDSTLRMNQSASFAGTASASPASTLVVLGYLTQGSGVTLGNQIDTTNLSVITNNLGKVSSFMSAASQSAVTVVRANVTEITTQDQLDLISQYAQNGPVQLGDGSNYYVIEIKEPLTLANTTVYVPANTMIVVGEWDNVKANYTDFASATVLTLGEGRGTLTLNNVTVESTDSDGANAADGKDTIIVDARNSLVINGTKVFAVVNADPELVEVSNNDASYVNTTSRVVVGYGSTLNLSGDVTTDITVYGNLIVSSDVTFSAESEMNVYRGANVTVDGDLEILGEANLFDGSTTTVNGSITMDNGTDGATMTIGIDPYGGDANGAGFTVAETGTVTLAAPNSGYTQYNTIIINNEKSVYDMTERTWTQPRFLVQGTLDMRGAIAGYIYDMGSITFNGSSVGNAKDVDGTIVLFPGMSITVTSVTGTLEITDEGTLSELDRATSVSDDTKRDVSDGNTVSLFNVRNVTVSVSQASTTYENTAGDNITDYYTIMDVSGQITSNKEDAGNHSTIGLSSVVVDEDGVGKDNAYGAYVQVSTSITVGRSVELVFSAGNTQVSGEITAIADVSDNVANDFAATITNEDEFTVTGHITVFEKEIDSRNGINAMHYVIQDAEGDDYHHYSGFAAAIAAAGDTIEDSVDVFGTVVVTETGNVPAGITVNMDSDSQLVVDEDVVLTIANGASLDGSTCSIDVNGTFTIENVAENLGFSESYILADVVVENLPAKTWTTLANALADAEAGDRIVLNQKIVIDSDTEIPAGVEVYTNISVDAPVADEPVIRITDDATLTVTGTLTMDRLAEGSITIDDGSKMVVGGQFSAKVMEDATTYASTHGLDAIAGAHFIMYDASYDVVYITNVNIAATTVSDNTNLQSHVTIKGSVSATDATFAGTDEGLIIDVEPLGDEPEEMTVFTMAGATLTLDNATLNIGNNCRVSGTIATADASFTLANAGNVVIEDVVDGEGETETSVNNYVNPVTGSVTLATGAAVVDAGLAVSADGYIGVASGATMTVERTIGISTDTSATGAAKETFVVDGTIVFEDNATITSDAIREITINGTMNVGTFSIQNGNVLRVTGDLNVAEDKTLTIAGTLILGDKISDLGASTTGAVTGVVTISTGKILAYNGADLTAAEIDINEALNESTAAVTSYVINGNAYATVYMVGTTTETVYDAMVNADGAIDLTGWETPKAVNNTDPDVWYAVENFNPAVDDCVDDDAVGEYATVYAEFAASEITGTISKDAGIILTIDDIVVFSDSSMAYDYSLSVGTHTIAWSERTGYNIENVTVTFNGEAVENGGTITITADMQGFTIIADGAVPGAAPSGETSTGGDDGMGLTDYLLIVLVVLIVIMAIMVALRLMRS